MATQAEQQIEALMFLIDEGVNDFVSSLPPIERKTYATLITLTKELDVKDGNIKRSTKNLQLLSKIKKEVSKILSSDQYKSKIKDFVSVYDKIQVVQDKYFQTLTDKFTPKKLFNEIKKANVESTIDSLTESGVSAAYIDGIRKILKTHITSGASYADMAESLRKSIIGEGDEVGDLTRYVNQVATDSVNTYAANYNQTVTDDLGLEWYQYVGSIKKTSREFCKVLVKRRYFHVSEIPGFLNGIIGDKKVDINPTTGLPYGMKEDTTVETFLQNRGGWVCGHQIFPVASINVPKEIRDQVV